MIEREGGREEGTARVCYLERESVDAAGAGRGVIGGSAVALILFPRATCAREADLRARERQT